MRIVPEEPKQYTPELKAEFEVEDLHDLWNTLDDINQPCCLVPKRDEEGRCYFKIVHPYEY